MTIKEHLIENAIFGMATGKEFLSWVHQERAYGNLIDDADEFNLHDLELIWDCAYYVVYTLFEGPADFLKKNRINE